MLDDKILFCGENSICILDPKSSVIKCQERQLAHCVHIDDEERLWLGTKGDGIDIYEIINDSFIFERSIHQINGMPLGTVYQIESYKQYIYIAAEQGLFKGTSVKSGSMHFEQLSEPSTEYLQYGMSADNQHLFIHQRKGFDFIAFDSRKQKSSKKPVITDFRLLEHRKGRPRKISFTSDILLSPRENSFSISFSTLHYAKPKVKFAYQLAGYDIDWISAEESGNEAYFTQVPPGSYVFKVKESHADQSDASAIRTINIQISPAWWQTWWFFLIFSTCACVLGIMWYRNRLRVEREKQQMQIRLLEEELSSLRAQMNPHFLFNSLNSIKASLAQNDARTAELYLADFAKLMRKVLANSKKKLVRLSDELEVLKLYLKVEKMRFKDKFRYRLIVREEVQVDFVEMPPMMIQPFIENAIWHGLMPKENDDGFLFIEFNQNQEALTCTIRDNGIGRIASKHQKNLLQKKDQSLGMEITQDRIRLINEIYGTSASVCIEDLQDDQGKPAGTSVQIHWPYI